jgi:hypothetical protein
MTLPPDDGVPAQILIKLGEMGALVASVGAGIAAWVAALHH